MVRYAAMKINLAEFENFPAKKTLKAGAGEITLQTEGVEQVKSVIMDLSIQESDDEYFCQGSTTSVVSLQCARCLEPYDLKAESAVDFVICTQAKRSEHEKTIDNEDYVYFEGSDLQADLTDTVCQVILLAIPMKPICSDECPGICSQCGTNLKKARCGCTEDKTDDRWEGLKALSATNHNSEGLTDGPS